MNGHDFLLATAAVVREGWCSDAEARDSSGRPVSALDPTATEWSLTSALALVAEQPSASLRALSDALWGISGVIPDWSLDAWNNAAGRSQADTLRMLDAAAGSLARRPPPRPELN
jgi:hypothetical protein